MGRFTATIYYYINYLLKVFLILCGVRVVLMLLDLTFIPIPIMDPLILWTWDIIKTVIAIIAGSNLIPRLV